MEFFAAYAKVINNIKKLSSQMYINVCINNAIITNAIIYKKIPWNAFYLCTIWLWQINYSCGYFHEYKNLINYTSFDENLEKSSVNKKSEGQSRINVNLILLILSSKFT